MQTKRKQRNESRGSRQEDIKNGRQITEKKFLERKFSSRRKALGLIFKLTILTVTPNVSRADDRQILLGYRLWTRQVPPDLYLLRGDTYIYYPFDYTTYPMLATGMTLKFGMKFIPSGLFEFSENSNDPTQCFIVIDLGQLGNKTSLVFTYTLTAYFTLGDLTEASNRTYQFNINIIDKYKTSIFNYDGFEDEFLFKIRSNETNIAFPLNSNHIFGNMLDVYIEQYDTRGDTISNSNTKIQTKISDKIVSTSHIYYRKLFRVIISKIVDLNSNHIISVTRRTDIPNKYRIKLIIHNLKGYAKMLYFAVLEDFEYIVSIKINSFYHLFICNQANGQSMQIFFQIKMTKSSLSNSDIPLGTFYDEYKQTIFQNLFLLEDVSMFRENQWLSKLFFLQRVDPKRSYGDLTQKIHIMSVYLPGPTQKFNGLIRLENFIQNIKPFAPLGLSYKNVTCDQIHALSGKLLCLRCRLFNVDPYGGDAHLIYVMMDIFLESPTGPTFGYKIKEVISPPVTKTKYLSTCFVDLSHVDNKANQKYLVHPFLIAFYEETKGIFMLTKTKEYLELLEIDEIDKGMILRSSICNQESKTFSLRYTKPADKPTPDFQAEALFFILNLDSKNRGNDRIKAKKKLPLPFPADQSDFLSGFFNDTTNTLNLFNVFRISTYKVMFFRMKVDLSYPKISLETNSSEPFESKLKVYTNKEAQETGGFGFIVNMKAKNIPKTQINLISNIPPLSNGAHNFEDFINVTGSLASLQVVRQNKRLQISPRITWVRRLEIPDDDYFHMTLIPEKYFFGLTKDYIVFHDYATNSSSAETYSMIIKAYSPSCCSAKQSFYVLYYDPSIKNVFTFTRYEATSLQIPNIQNSTKEEDTVIVLNEVFSKSIEYSLLEDIRIQDSKQIVKSISDKLAMICIHTKDLVKILVVKNEGSFVSVIGQHPYSSTELDIGDDIHSIEVIPLTMRDPNLKTVVLVVGTESRIVLKFVQLRLFTNDNKLLVNQPHQVFRYTQNGLLDFITCYDIIDKPIPGTQHTRIVEARCEAIVRAYIMQTLRFEFKIENTTENGNSASSDVKIHEPMKTVLNEYYIPRFSKIIKIIPSDDFIGVLTENRRDYHKEFLIYKRGVEEVWSSMFVPYEMTSSFELKKVRDGNTYAFIKEIGTNLKAYKISNMSLEVGQGYDKRGQFQFVYSTFGYQQAVKGLQGTVEFKENLVKHNNIILVIYGSVGGFFGFIILLWCCCCFWRCIYVCFFRKLEKREKLMVPKLIQKKRILSQEEDEEFESLVDEKQKSHKRIVSHSSSSNDLEL